MDAAKHANPSSAVQATGSRPVVGDGSVAEHMRAPLSGRLWDRVQGAVGALRCTPVWMLRGPAPRTAAMCSPRLRQRRTAPSVWAPRRKSHSARRQVGHRRRAVAHPAAQPTRHI